MALSEERLAQIRSAAAARANNGGVKTIATDTTKNVATIPTKEDTKDKSDPTEKTYYARVAHSRFIMPDAYELIFHFGRARISESLYPGEYIGPEKDKRNGRPKYKVYQEELDVILGKNPNIFVPDTIASVQNIPVPAQNAVNESDLAAAERSLINSGAVMSIDTSGEGTDGQPTDVGQSSLDPELQAAMFRNAGAASSVSS